ncbi:MAG: COX15/CtaA family protein [Planctomycetales bacterium]|nr:COX15/CtaA family protein [Planctomycetales bacterium]
MSTSSSSSSVPSRLPHGLAMVLVALTFPLIWVGGLVTTYDAGMAVPDWPTTYEHNMFLYPLKSWLSGPWDLFIEHGHRLLASFVGFVTIGVVLVTWMYDERKWVRWFSLSCLALVVIQGLLGGMRVLFDQNLLARIHGCVGPLFFVAAVALAAFTSTWWRDASAPTATHRYTRTATVTAAMAYLQLVLGAHLRHLSYNWPASVFSVLVAAHLLVAVALLGHVLLMAWRVSTQSDLRSLQLVRRPTNVLATLVLLQLILGAGVWRVKYNWPDWLPQPSSWQGHIVTAEGTLQIVTVTAHVAIGSLILAMAVLVALRASRLLQGTEAAAAADISPLTLGVTR